MKNVLMVLSFIFVGILMVLVLVSFTISKAFMIEA